MDQEIKQRFVYGVNYPLQDSEPGHHPHYVRYPVNVDGKWYAAEVVKKGYISPQDNPAKVPFESQKECKKACDLHNNYHQFTEDFIEGVVSRSMGSLKWDKN